MVLLEVEEPISGSESAPRLHQGISRSVIAAAIEVHRALGQGVIGVSLSIVSMSGIGIARTELSHGGKSPN